uniref:Uncharacterized protein n=1 Tax=Mycolicibacterium gilvum (strain PYR-GCK) TaxID=350054 RepID=A4T1D2_MYCGI|nr:hypothetical protein Mflv_5208 [Mycolicibacterium gilvum PYR-GCK]
MSGVCFGRCDWGSAIVKTAFNDDDMAATWVNLIGLILLMLLQPVGGMISDKIGR